MTKPGMLKMICTICIIMAGVAVFGQHADPVRGASPTDTLTDTTTIKEAFNFADSCFKGTEFIFDLTEPDMSPDILQIMLKFNNAVAADKQWFLDYQQKYFVEGKGLPYNERFGITREEYDRVTNIDKASSTLKTVMSTTIGLLRQDGKLSFKGVDSFPLLNYLEFDLKNKRLSFAGDTLRYSGESDVTSSSIIGPWHGYSWKLERADWPANVKIDEITAKYIEVQMGRTQRDNKIFLRIKYQQIEKGQSKANMDLSGFIR